MLAALVLLMTSSAAFADEFPNSSQLDFISAIVKVSIAKKQCGFKRNDPVIYAAMSNLGMTTGDLQDGGRFAKSFREMRDAIIGELADIRRDNQVPQDVLCA